MTREALKKLNEKQMELLSGYEVKALYLWFISGNRGE